MREPVSTLTNAAYILAGAYAAASGAWLYAATLALLGIASGGFHATLDWRWQAADECAMYAALCALTTRYGVPIELAALAAAILVVNWRSVSSFTFVPALAAVNVVLIALQSPTLALVLAVIASVSFAIRQYGETSGGAVEDIAHGAWHLLTACGLGVAGNGLRALL